MSKKPSKLAAGMAAVAAIGPLTLGEKKALSRIGVYIAPEPVGSLKYRERRKKRKALAAASRRRNRGK